MVLGYIFQWCNSDAISSFRPVSSNLKHWVRKESIPWSTPCLVLLKMPYLWSDLIMSVLTSLLHSMVHVLIEKGWLSGPPISVSQSVSTASTLIAWEVMLNTQRSNMTLELKRRGCDSLSTTAKTETTTWVVYHSLKITLQSPVLRQLRRCGMREAAVWPLQIAELCSILWVFSSCGLDMEKHTQPVWLRKLQRKWNRKPDPFTACWSVKTHKVCRYSFYPQQKKSGEWNPAVGGILRRGDAEATWQKSKQEQRPVHWARKTKQN